MSDDTLRQDLINLFRSDVSEHGDVLQECLSTCRLFAMSAQDLYIQWEAFDLSNNVNAKKKSGRTELTVSLVKDLKAHIQRSRELEAARVVATTHRTAAPRRSMPSRGLARTSLGSSATLVRAQDVPPPVARPRVEFREGISEVPRSYRYMHGKVSQRSEVLDDVIDDFSELVREHYGLEDLGDPGSVTEDDVVVVGRVCCETDMKLNEASIVLEASRMGGSGSRTPLKFEPNFTFPGHSEKGISFFPGQIVVLKGRNGGGGWFSVSEVVEIPSLPPSAPPGAIPSTSTTAFSTVIGCGPFTADADLFYKPLEALLTEVTKLKPGVLILVGPFVDTNHSLIKKGDIDHTPTEIFQHRISSRLQMCLQACPGMTVALVPSVRDLISFHVAYPQAAFPADEELGLPKAVHLLPNPCSAVMNGVTIAAGSADVLFHLRKEEFVKRIESPGSSAPLDPMASLAQHVLEQRSFYPIFPPPKEGAADVNLDLVHYNALRIGPAAPAVLILPSMLKQFHKIVNQTLVINPSFVSRGNFAYLQCPDASMLPKAEEGHFWESYWKVAEVDLRRLSS